MAVGGGGSSSLAGTWSQMVGSEGNRASFIESVQGWLLAFGFQGIDLDWEFPESVEDRDGFVSLVREMRESFDRDYKGMGWGISVVLWVFLFFLGGFWIFGDGERVCVLGG